MLVTVSLPFNTLLTSSETEPKYQMLLPRDQLRAVVEKAVGGADRLQAILKGDLTAVGSCVCPYSPLDKAVVRLMFAVSGRRALV